MPVTAVAHPNIALVKYWGKQSGDDNLPATPSLSVTLDQLESRTTITPAGTGDSVRLNGAPVRDPKIDGWLQRLRESFDVPPLRIDTTNNFPTGAGLASSASGFAALITAIDAACELRLTADQRSSWARLGSGSAARSTLGGFVALHSPDWVARPLLALGDWPLRVVIAVTSSARKAVSSTEGMRLSSVTSPYYAHWLKQTERDFLHARDAVAARDFDRLADIAESSCMKMHALMLSTRPPLIYWNGATIDCVHTLRALRADGVQTFYTIDAGPQVKAVCEPAEADGVAAALAGLAGVTQVLNVPLGGPPAVV